jgi:hypothetical protein
MVYSGVEDTTISDEQCRVRIKTITLPAIILGDENSNTSNTKKKVLSFSHLNHNLDSSISL